MPEESQDIPRINGACPRCRLNQWSHGWVRDSHSHRQVFETHPRSEADQIAGKGRGLIYGRVCQGCNALELFVDGLDLSG